MRAAALAAALALLAAAPAAADDAATLEARDDERVELLAAVQLLAGGDGRLPGFFFHDDAYGRAFEKRFRPFRGHPAVSRYAALARDGLTFLTAYEVVLGWGPLPDLEAAPLSEPDLQSLGGPQGAEEFRLLLADFARASRFREFFAKTQPERDGYLKEVRRQLKKLSVRRPLEEYCGFPVKAAYTVIVSAFAEPALSISMRSTDPDGRSRVTTVYGPEEHEGRLRFRLHTRTGGFWVELLLGELLARAEPHREAFERSKALFGPVSSSCAGTWHDCVQRQIAFAAAARLLERGGDAESAREWPVKYGRIGMPHLGPLVGALKDYERERKRYPALTDFYPRLAAVLESLAAAPSEVPFLGDLERSHAEAGPTTLIEPDAAAPGLRKALEILRARWPAARRLTGSQALKEALRGQTLVVLGTPATNAWLGGRLGDLSLPARLESDGLSFNPRSGEEKPSRVEGKVGYATTALNPDDRTRPALLYTGVDEAAAAAAAEVGARRADYVLLVDGREIKSGVYEKSRLPWRLK
jgi:hypothetical protein